jgi:hypothetical protein
MSFPLTQQLPTQEPVYIPATHRRREKQPRFPAAMNERLATLDEILRKTMPTFDYLIFTLFSGLILITALLLNSLPLCFLASLCASFMAPFLGISTAIMRGSIVQIVKSVGGVVLGGLIIFICGILAGLISRILPVFSPEASFLHLEISSIDLFILTIGVILTLLLVKRTGKPRQLTISAALSFELYIPLAAAGFGLASGLEGYWPNGWNLFCSYLAWSILVGILVLIISKFKPVNTFSFAMIGVILGLNIFLLSGGKSAFAIPIGVPEELAKVLSTSTPITYHAESGTNLPTLVNSPAPVSTLSKSTPTPTSSPTPQRITSTPTIIPTYTPTITDTPMPTPVWAKIHAGEKGAVIRETASGNSNIIKFMDNNSLVQLLPDTIARDGVLWIKVRLVDGHEGWMLRNLLITATPQAGR